MKPSVAILAALLVTSLARPLELGGVGPDPQGLPDHARAEVGLPSPEWHAVIRSPDESTAIYRRGDAVFKPGDVTPTAVVRAVNATALVVQEPTSGKTHLVPRGHALPGLPGLRFLRGEVLDHLTYRYRYVDRAPRPDPVLVSLQGSRAVLDVEVSRAAFTLAALPTGTPALPSQRRAPDPTILAKMRVTERNPNSYEVNAADMQALMENADRVVLDLLPKVRPMFSMEKGLSYHLSGPAGEGTLSSEGFTITSLKIANRIGLEAGDTILRINGRPVDGFASAFRIYFEIRRDPSRPTITVDLLRKGLPLTKAYRIR